MRDQAFRLDPEDSEIGVHVEAHDPRVLGPAVDEADTYARRAPDDVSIRGDQSVLGEDHARALAEGPFHAASDREGLDAHDRGSDSRRDVHVRLGEAPRHLSRLEAVLGRAAQTGAHGEPDPGRCSEEPEPGSGQRGRASNEFG